MGSPFGELTVIVNPHAGRRRVGQEIPELERTLQARGLAYQLLRTEGPGDATRFAREALLGGGRFVVAVGGDGTVHEVVNGMFGEGGTTIVPQPVLGVVAAGSGCDFVDVRPPGRRHPVVPTPVGGEHLPPRCGQDHICGLERGAAGSVLPQRGRGRTGGGGGGTGRPASRLARPGEILLRVLADAAPVQAGEAEGPSRPQGVRGAGPHGDRGQLPVLRGRDEDLTSLVPGRRGPRRVDLQGTEVGLVHAAAEGLPGRASPTPSGRGVPGEGGP